MNNVNVVPEGVWTHVGFSWTAGGGAAAMKFYVNGQSVAIDANAPAVGDIPRDPGAGKLRAFVNQTFGPSTGSEFVGAMDDLRVYDEILTQDQIQFIMDPPIGTTVIVR